MPAAATGGADAARCQPRGGAGALFAIARARHRCAAIAAVDRRQPLLSHQQAACARLFAAHGRAYFHLAEDGRSVPKYADAPFAFVWGGQDAAQPVYADRGRVPALPDEEPATPSPGTLLGRLAQAEQAVQAQPQQADGWQQLAELLHFELYWLDAAAALYEQALKLDPER